MLLPSSKVIENLPDQDLKDKYNKFLVDANNDPRLVSEYIFLSKGITAELSIGKSQKTCLAKK